MTAAAPQDRPAAAPKGSEELLGQALDRVLLRRIFACVVPHKRLLVGALALLPIATLFELAQPYLLKQAIDQHIAVGRPVGLDRLGLLYLGALVCQYAASSTHLYLTQIAGQRAMNDLRERVYRHVLTLAQTFFDRTPVGRLMTRMTNDIESLNEMFASGIVSLAGDVVKLVAILVALFTTDWRLAAFSMLTAPLLFGVAALFRRMVREAFRAVRTQLARLNGFLQEHLSGMKVVQAFAQEALVSLRFTGINGAYRAASARAIAADAALYAIVEAIGALAIAALLWHGGGRIFAGTLTVGVFVFFIENLSKFFAPIRELSNKYTVMQQAMAAAERVFALLDTEEADAPRPTQLPVSTPSAEGHLVLDHVRFGYRRDAVILDDLSVAIRHGETVALVGPSGAGKSTFIRLLTRLYEPQEGRIYLGGQDIRALGTDDLRRRIVVVAQDPFLFAGTLRDNIGLGRPDASDPGIEAALRRVGGGRLLDARPEALASVVAERGANLSAGERQLVSFARALYRDPEILILDEATASVDPETERLIERGVSELLRGRTSIVVAHRFTTIGRAHRILVVEGGRVAEEGTHSTLLAQSGTYARLYRLQSSSSHPASAR